MPFCPDCRIEYRPGFTICPDCHKHLVDELPEAPLPEGSQEPNYTEDWIPLAQFGTQAYAAIIEDGFKSLEIPVTLLSSTGHFGQIGAMGTAFLPIAGAYIILVPREDVERADREGLAMLGDVWRSSRLADHD